MITITNKSLSIIICLLKNVRKLKTGKFIDRIRKKGKQFERKIRNKSKTDCV